jgi:hypothetical protein
MTGTGLRAAEFRPWIDGMKTVIALFDDFEGARRAVALLLERGHARADISLVAHDAARRGRTTDVTQEDYQSDVPIVDAAGDAAGTGAAIGAGVGGLVGFLAGAGALVLPGIGPVLAVGPLLAGLTGAGVGAGIGGLVGTLAQAGVPQHDAEFYAEAVRRGGTLVVVRANDGEFREVAGVLEGQGALDVEERRSQLEESGYGGFREDVGALTDDELAAERDRARTEPRAPARPGAVRTFGSR